MGGGTIGTPVSSSATGVPASGADRFPLELWRQTFSVHPFHFWQLANDDMPQASCGDVLYKYAWQYTDRAGREDISRAIDSAVDILTRHLGYSPFPRYAWEVLPWPRYNDVRVSRYPYSDATGRWVNVELKRGRYTQALGVESLTLIDGAAVVVYSDADGDGVQDTFTASAPTTVTDTNEIAVYFAAGDRLTTTVNDWRIQPVRVSIAAGTVTITGPKWIVVRPVKYEGVVPQELDPASAANFITTLAVYRRTTYMGGTTLDDCQAKFIWETVPLPCFCTDNAPTTSTTDPAAVGYAVGRGGVRDSRLGIVTPAEALYSGGLWASPSLNSCWREPDRVLVRYNAGWPLVDGQIDPVMVRLVCRLAAAELGRPICACEWANKEIARWQVDLARTGGNDDDAYGGTSPDDLANPIGTRRGHVAAWKFIQDQAIRPATLF